MPDAPIVRQIAPWRMIAKWWCGVVRCCPRSSQLGLAGLLLLLGLGCLFLSHLDGHAWADEGVQFVNPSQPPQPQVSVPPSPGGGVHNTALQVTPPKVSKPPQPKAKKSEEAIDDTAFSIASMAAFSSHNPVANLLCLYANHDRTSHYNKCQSIKTNSDISSFQALLEGEIQFVIADAKTEKHAVTGSGPFAGRKFERLRLVTPIYKEAFLAMVKASSDVKSLKDLRGKRVGMLDQSSSSKRVLDELLAAHQLKTTDFRTFNVIKNEERISSICNDRVDALVIIAEQPSSTVKEISRFCEIDIVPISDEIITYLSGTNPEYEKIVIPGGTYIGVPFKVSTIGFEVALYSTSDVSDGMVLSMLNSIQRHEHIFSMTYPYLKKFSIDRGISVALARSGDKRAMPHRAVAILHRQKQQQAQAAAAAAAALSATTQNAADSVSSPSRQAHHGSGTSAMGAQLNGAAAVGGMGGSHSGQSLPPQPAPNLPPPLPPQ